VRDVVPEAEGQEGVERRGPLHGAAIAAVVGGDAVHDEQVLVDVARQELCECG
jgi:hypothetical protein